MIRRVFRRGEAMGHAVSTGKKNTLLMRTSFKDSLDSGNSHPASGSPQEERLGGGLSSRQEEAADPQPAQLPAVPASAAVLAKEKIRVSALLAHILLKTSLFY